MIFKYNKNCQRCRHQNCRIRWTPLLLADQIKTIIVKTRGSLQHTSLLWAEITMKQPLEVLVGLVVYFVGRIVWYLRQWKYLFISKLPISTSEGVSNVARLYFISFGISDNEKYLFISKPSISTLEGVYSVARLYFISFGIIVPIVVYLKVDFCSCIR